VGTPSPKGKGKRHQKSPTPEVLEEVEYDDQAWVAAANNIVAELIRTNSLLERSILAAEGSRAAADRMCSGLEIFVRQQREFQAMLFGELRMGLRANPEEVRKSLEEVRKSLEEVRKSLEEVRKSSDEGEDVEKEDEEMDKGSGSEESGSGEVDESMEV
jgi:hypothetical protein